MMFRMSSLVTLDESWQLDWAVLSPFFLALL